MDNLINETRTFTEIIIFSVGFGISVSDNYEDEQCDEYTSKYL